MKRYFNIFLLFFQHALNYRARSFMWFLISFINPLVLLLFWNGIIAHKNSFGVWNGQTIFSYYLLLMVSQSFLQSHIDYDVARNDIKGGELLRELLKPFSYIKLRLISELPWRLIQGLFGIITVFALTKLFDRPLVINLDLSTLPLIVMIWINAYLISYHFKMSLALLAFWITNVEGIFEMNDILIIVLAGLILPINLFPQWLQTITAFTPYAYTLYHPVVAVIGMYNPAQLLNIVLIQIAWLLGLMLMTKFLWNRGLKQFTGVGQ